MGLISNLLRFYTLVPAMQRPKLMFNIYKGIYHGGSQGGQSSRFYGEGRGTLVSYPLGYHLVWREQMKMG